MYDSGEPADVVWKYPRQLSDFLAGFLFMAGLSGVAVWATFSSPWPAYLACCLAGVAVGVHISQGEQIELSDSVIARTAPKSRQCSLPLAAIASIDLRHVWQRASILSLVRADGETLRIPISDDAAHLRHTLGQRLPSKLISQIGDPEARLLLGLTDAQS